MIGNESLLIQCAEILRQRGHRIAAVVTSNAPSCAAAAMGHGLRSRRWAGELADRLDGVAYDWLFSIVNHALTRRRCSRGAGAINYHDGPLRMAA